MVAFRSVHRARFCFVFSLDDTILTAIQIPACEPLFTATFNALEKIEPFEISIYGHPRWIISAIDTGACIYVWVICVIVNDRRKVRIVPVVVIRFPIVTLLFSVFVGTIRHTREVFRTTLVSTPEEIVFFIAIVSHPRWVVPTKTTAISAEIRKVVIVQWIWVAVISFIFGIGTHSTLTSRTVSAGRVPFFTTIAWLLKQIVIPKAFLPHPMLVVVPKNTIKLIDQVWEIKQALASLSAKIRSCFTWCKEPFPFSAREMDWPREWGMRIFTILQTVGGTREMRLTAFQGRAIDLEIIWLVHF